MGVRIWDDNSRPVFNTFTGFERIPAVISESGPDANVAIQMSDIKAYAQGTSGAASYLSFANLASFPNPGTAGIFYIALDTNNVYIWTGSLPYQQVAPPTGTSLQNKFRVITGSGTVTTYYSDYQSALTAAASGDLLEMFADATISTGSALKSGVNLKMNGYSLIISASLTTLVSASVRIMDYGVIRTTSSSATINIDTSFALDAPFVRCGTGVSSSFVFTCASNSVQFAISIGSQLISLGGALVKALTMSSSGNIINIRGAEQIYTTSSVAVGIVVSAVKINSLTVNINGDYSTDGTNGMFAFSDSSSTLINVTARAYNGRIVSIDGNYYLQDLTQAVLGTATALNASKGNLYCRDIHNTSAIPALTIFNMSIRCQDIYGNLDATLHDIYARYYFGATGVAFTGVFYERFGTSTPTVVGTSNVSSISAIKETYKATGNMLSVFGEVTITPSGAGSTSATLSIPDLMQFTINGYSGQLTSTLASGYLVGISTNVMSLTFIATTGGSQLFFYSYQVPIQ